MLTISKFSKTSKIFIVIGIGLVSYFCYSAYTLNEIKSSPAYKAAIAEIESLNKVRKATGEIVSYGLFPTREIYVHEGNEVIKFTIRVHGKNQSVDVTIWMMKHHAGFWDMKDYLITYQ